MKKKAQLSLFIIIGIVILAIVSLAYFGLNTTKAQTAQIEFDRPSINAYITNCLQIEAEDALFLLGKQGGNINPEQYLQTDNYKISYLLNEGKNNVPTKENIENQLSSYIDNNLLECLNNFDDFKKLGWKANFNNPNTKTQINLEDISFITNFETSFTLGESTIEINQFSHNSKVRLSKILDITNEIVDFHISNPEWTDLTSLSGYDLEITLFPYNKKLVYSIEDKKSELKAQPYLFNFALDFS